MVIVMPYDEMSFLAGVAAGRNMRSIPWLEGKKNGVFSMTVLISASETSMTFRLHYYFMGHIWWGDGAEEDSTTFSYNVRDHTYTAEGIYTITLFGAGWEFRGNDSILTIDRPLLPVPENMVPSLIAYSISVVAGNKRLRKLPERLFSNVIKSGMRLELDHGAFRGCESLEELPKRLFEGAVAANPDYNIDWMFYGCKSLKRLPDDLFSNEQMFGRITTARWVFENCDNLEYIPGNLMRNFQKVTSFQGMFEFGGDKIKEIPEGLFADLESAITFDRVFVGCNNLEYIPDNCFDNCPNAAWFRESFAGGYAITSPVPALWEKYPNANGSACYLYCTRAANYADIPSAWRLYDF